MKIKIPSRYNGPPNVANGGILAARMTEVLGYELELTLRSPAPLETEMEIVPTAEGDQLMNGDKLIATARNKKIDVKAPEAPDLQDALEASKKYIGFREHPFPTCFVCGTQRHEDGLCLAPGPIKEGIIAGPWTPNAEFDDGSGFVRTEIMWAALDCPSGIVIMKERFKPVVTGKMAAHIDRPVPVEKPCIVLGWIKSQEGRKHHTGSAIYAPDGQLCAVSDLVWIEL